MEREEYSQRMQFEHELINRRLTWLLTSQSLLFAAYAVALEGKEPNANFLRIMAVTGMVIAILVLAGLLAAFAAKYCTWQDFKRMSPNEQFWVRTPITYVAFVPEAALPIVFAVAWASILCLR